MANIDEVREKLRLFNVTALASKAKVSPHTLWRFVKGGDIRMSTLEKILQAIK